jgi:hypothetical protein
MDTKEGAQRGRLITEPRFDRFYLPHGQVAHAISNIGPRSLYTSAACRTGPGFGSFWLGTGTQDEYEKAATLPRCRRCELRIGNNW